MTAFLSESVQRYLDELASGAPTPGGGSAAGLCGAMGAALLCMSARFTVGREKYAAFEAEAQRVLGEAEPLRAAMQQLMEEDARAYAGYREASAMPKATDEEKARRREALREATKHSAHIPMKIVRHAHRLLELAVSLASNCNPYLVSDVAVAARLSLSAFQSALVNVRINLVSLDDAEFVAGLENELASLIADAPRLAQEATEISYRVMNLSFEGDYPA